MNEHEPTPAPPPPDERRQRALWLVNNMPVLALDDVIRDLSFRRKYWLEREGQILDS